MWKIFNNHWKNLRTLSIQQYEQKIRILKSKFLLNTETWEGILLLLYVYVCVCVLFLGPHLEFLYKKFCFKENFLVPGNMMDEKNNCQDSKT